MRRVATSLVAGFDVVRIAKRCFPGIPGKRARSWSKGQRAASRFSRMASARELLLGVFLDAAVDQGDALSARRHSDGADCPSPAPPFYAHFW